MHLEMNENILRTSGSGGIRCEGAGTGPANMEFCCKARKADSAAANDDDRSAEPTVERNGVFVLGTSDGNAGRCCKSPHNCANSVSGTS